MWVGYGRAGFHAAVRKVHFGHLYIQYIQRNYGPELEPQTGYDLTVLACSCQCEFQGQGCSDSMF